MTKDVGESGDRRVDLLELSEQTGVTETDLSLWSATDDRDQLIDEPLVSRTWCSI